MGCLHSALVCAPESSKIQESAAAAQLLSLPMTSGLWKSTG